MFLFEYSSESCPFNSTWNISEIKRIQWINLRYVHGWECDQLEKDEDAVISDQYEIKITFKDDSFKTFSVHEERDVQFFLRQIKKLGLEE